MGGVELGAALGLPVPLSWVSQGAALHAQFLPALWFEAPALKWQPRPKGREQATGWQVDGPGISVLRAGVHASFL